MSDFTPTHHLPVQLAAESLPRVTVRYRHLGNLSKWIDVVTVSCDGRVVRAGAHR